MLKKEEIITLIGIEFKKRGIDLPAFEFNYPELLPDIAQAIMELQAKDILGNLVFTPEKLESYFKEASMWEEQVCRLLKLQLPSVKGLEVKFIAECKVKEATWNTMADAKSHFINYARKQPKETVLNAAPKRNTTYTSSDKYNNFIRHVKTYKAIPPSTDWIQIYEYLCENKKMERGLGYDELSYPLRLKEAEKDIKFWVGLNYTLVDQKPMENKGGTGLGSLLKNSMDRLK